MRGGPPGSAQKEVGAPLFAPTLGALVGSAAYYSRQTQNAKAPGHRSAHPVGGPRYAPPPPRPPVESCGSEPPSGTRPQPRGLEDPEDLEDLEDHPI